jgi:hypothetical protein
VLPGVSSLPRVAGDPDVGDLTPIIFPIVVSVILSVSGAFVVARYSGPAQTAYISALDGRLRVVTAERDEATARIPKLEARIVALEDEGEKLKDEITDLYRRLNAPRTRVGR